MYHDVLQYTVYSLILAYGIHISSLDWTTVARRGSSSSWCPVSCLTHIMDSSNTQLMTPTLCKSALCQPSWITTMNGESVGNTKQSINLQFCKITTTYKLQQLQLSTM